MIHMTSHQAAVLLIDILDEHQHIQITQEDIEENFASLPVDSQESISPKFIACLSVFLRQQKQMRLVQSKIETLLAAVEKEAM
jgi:hypothetical protein